MRGSAYLFPGGLGWGVAAVLLLAGATASAAPVTVTLRPGTEPNPGLAHYTSVGGGGGLYSPTTPYQFSLPSSTFRTVRFEFTDLLLYGHDVVNLSQLATGVHALGGTLVQVGIAVTLNRSEPPDPAITGNPQTEASDLMILVGAPTGTIPDDTTALLQVGGWDPFTPPSAESTAWSSFGSPLTSQYTLVTPLTLAASPSGSDPVVWLGNGYTTAQGATWGDWTGYVDLSFSVPGPGGVPEGGATLWLVAGAVAGLAGWRARGGGRAQVPGTRRT